MCSSPTSSSSARAPPGSPAIFEGAWLRLADGVAVQWAAAYGRQPGHRILDLLRSLAAIVLRPRSVTTVIPSGWRGHSHLSLLGASAIAARVF